ncbi:pyridoxal-phosphate dependent enzyme [Paraburkholderia sediminicola]|uniref:pyridoxal-phosphate dependent enzyme n=1 Tax=Paraburkholderia sediminicola TaxID=458836 RepID=UPI0038B8E933
MAWGAQTFGCRCVIFVHAGVSEARREAIAAYGAEVRVVEGNYDDAVRTAHRKWPDGSAGMSWPIRRAMPAATHHGR